MDISPMIINISADVSSCDHSQLWDSVEVAIILAIEVVIIYPVNVVNGLTQGKILTGNQPDFPMKYGMSLQLFP